MHRFIYFVFLSVILSSTILSGLCSDPDPPEYLGDDYGNADIEETTTASLLTTATVVAINNELVIEQVDENVTEPIIDNTTESIVNNQTEVISFITEYSLNVNYSSSDITFNSYLNNSILILIVNKHQLYLISKANRTILNIFQNGNLISNQQSNILVIYDENAGELWLINSTSQQKIHILFKPKQIITFSSKPNLLIAETYDELHLSEDFGLNWRMIGDSRNSVVLGWSNQINSLIIRQHSQYIKLLNLNTHKITTILNDVSSGKLFSRYLLAKRLNKNDALSVSHVKNLDNEGFRSLNQRIQSEGKFYCAIEDNNNENLLLAFIIDDKLGENNETIPAICTLISYSNRNRVYLTNISCSGISDGKSLECTKEQLPFYQVHGLGKSVYLANIGLKPVTMISYDGGLNWNRTFYECDKTINCPNNFSVVISSLESSVETPGIVFGKVSNGVDEYFAVSSDGGRLWQISSLKNNSLVEISNPSALLVAVSSNTQKTLNHSFHYSTDYGRYWYEQKFLNQTSFQILSLTADNRNVFYLLTLNNENQLNLVELNLNILINQECSRHEIKEWSFPIGCINGSKLYYKRRVAGSVCLNQLSAVRSEPCTCTLADFQCLPGYKRSQDGLCLPKSQYTSAGNCVCNENQTYVTKTRGYTKSGHSQCTNGIENYLSQAYLTRRDVNHPNILIYGTSSQTKQSIVEVFTNEFNQDDDDEEDEEERDQPTRNPVWSVDETYQIRALAFNETGNQVYAAVEQERKSIIYRANIDLRQQNRSAKQLTFDLANELYTSFEEQIEYITVDWLTENIYVLARNRYNSQQTVFILNTHTHKRRTIIKNQQIQPSILILDPTKAEFYWISHSSPSVLNIGNLQGEIKKQFQLSSSNSSVSYVAYDPIAHEILYILNSTIYGLNTLDSTRFNSRIIYENSFPIENTLFISPVIYFTTRNNQTDSSNLYLNAIDILAKSFAKNLAKFKNFDSLKLVIDMIPSMPSNPNPCSANPCSDICISLGNKRFRCLCSEDALYLSCSCPKDEQYINGACQAKNGQCASGRVLCQNQQNCAESAQACEQDHTQYTPSFKNASRCTIEQPNDGFDCYYSINGMKSTCIPQEWFCDGTRDCPLGNDEDHCHKLTIAAAPVVETTKKCLIERRFSHVVCGSKCMRIKDICRNVTNQNLCYEEFHLHCKETLERNQYVCKCMDNNNRCYVMSEQCGDHDSCQRICQDSIHYANKEASRANRASSFTWIVLTVAILGLLFISLLVMTLRYRRKNAQNTSANSRTPVVTETVDGSPSDTHQKLLNNESNTIQATN